jgi:hypothetical protein
MARPLSVLLALCLIPGTPSATVARRPEPAQIDLGRGPRPRDVVTRGILSAPEVPRNVFEVRARLLGLGGKLQTFVLANRGRDNPRRGSFSFFETYTGPLPDGGLAEEADLYFGHFSTARSGVLTLDQDFGEGSLLMELIAWDGVKKTYNFYRLIGNGASATWTYFGDGDDAAGDTAQVYLGGPNPKAGKMTCAACHTLGVPVMKEIEPPHNDWAGADRLDLGPLKLRPGNDPRDPAHLAARLFTEASPAADFSRLVKKGIDRALAARAARGGPGTCLKQQLRSLFATLEVNLVTDGVPFPQRRRDGGAVEIPSDFFVDGRLLRNRRPVPVPLAVYEKTLAAVRARFAPGETPGLVESRHAFSVPGRSHVDNRVIDGLLEQGLLDKGLVAAVLAVDLATPVYSRQRAGLLKYVPDQARDAADLRRQLLAALREAPAADQAARELLANLTDPARSAAAQRKAAEAYLEACSGVRGLPEAVLDWWRLAAQRREEMAEAETAQHPGGKITEPDFKMLFPLSDLRPEPGRLRLDPRTGRCLP